MNTATLVFAAIFAVPGIAVLAVVAHATQPAPRRATIAVYVTAILTGAALLGLLLGD